MKIVKQLLAVSIILSLTTSIIGCGGNSDSNAASSATGLKAQEQQTFKWKMVTTWPKNFPGLGLAPENFSKLVDQMSNGRLTVKVYGAGEIVPALEVFSAVSSGTVEMGHGAAYYWKGKAPSSVFFTAVPFGMNAQEMNGWLHYGGGLALWHEVYEPFNLIPFAGGSTGVQMAGWFNKELKTIDDFKGLKMRIPGLGGEVFSRAGGTAVNMPGGEIFTSLQTGVIDAAEWVAPYNDLAFGFNNVAKYYYYPGWHEPGAILEFTVNKTAFNALPADLQAIVTVAARAINQDMLDEYTARNNAALVELKAKGDVKILPMPEDILTALKVITENILDENAANDELFSKVRESYRTFMENAASYHVISEEATYKTRH